MPARLPGQRSFLRPPSRTTDFSPPSIALEIHVRPESNRALVRRGSRPGGEGMDRLRFQGPSSWRTPSRPARRSVFDWAGARTGFGTPSDYMNLRVLKIRQRCIILLFATAPGAPAIRVPYSACHRNGTEQPMTGAGLRVFSCWPRQVLARVPACASTRGGGAGRGLQPEVPLCGSMVLPVSLPAPRIGMAGSTRGDRRRRT